MLAGLRKSIFAISAEEATFARRGFHTGDHGARWRLEQIGRTFLQGYHAALAEDDLESLACRLNTVEAEFRGFAFEGAAMGLALLDQSSPWQPRRLGKFLDGPAASHAYMVHVGTGWALARLPWCRQWPPAWLDPFLGWLAVDGYGFHEGYFYWRRYVGEQSLSGRLSGYACRVFDQGLGRSLWFVYGADVTQLPTTIAAFPLSRQADLWSGVGLACAYAGGVNRTAVEALRSTAEPYQPHLAQGAAFAAKARQRAGNPSPHTELACQVLCGLTADAAAHVTDVALENLPADRPEPAYEIWRQRIQKSFAKEVRTA